MVFASARHDDRNDSAARLACRTYGSIDAPAVVLLIGLGMRASEWPTTFVESLAQHRYVVCPDNRDAGGSPIFGPESEPDLRKIWLKRDKEAARRAAAYTLSDMHHDVLRLVDRLGVKKFDLVGFSMGGMIGQMVAASAGKRVGRFVQLASNDGTAEIDAEADAIRRMVRLFTAPELPGAEYDYLLSDTLYYGAGQLEDGKELQDEIARITAAGYRFGGSARQAIAVLAEEDRTKILNNITAKTLVLHGDSDPCISYRRGKAAADKIPNSEFRTLPGVGHVISGEMCDAALGWLLPNDNLN
ncbi:alpha/beta fold hydrolase [Ruegeria arenilitoris]|uniref:alpha/beta fold hydrolase n=1 Tax=Ruegeria arenilitoris TaxID=1173585 RepID=UPI00147A9D0C|nr:alpha/beta hydrolase [Ruegeria arenilitoris]